MDSNQIETRIPLSPERRKAILEELGRYVREPDLYRCDFKSWVDDVVMELEIRSERSIPLSRQLKYDRFVLWVSNATSIWGSDIRIERYIEIYGVDEETAKLMRAANDGEEVVVWTGIK